MKARKYVVVFIMMVFLSGCWGSTELSDISIVSVVGIDRNADGDIEITNNIIDPTAVKNGQKHPYTMHTITGKTVFKAGRQAITVIGEKQNWEHISAFIIGKDTAEESVLPILDFFSRDHEPRLKMYMMIANRPARELLENYPVSTKLPGRELRNAIDFQDKHLGEAPKVEYHNFIQKLRNPFEDPYLPVVHLSEEDEVQVYNTAVFDGERVIGYLGKQETVAFHRVIGKLKGGLQVVKLEEGEEGEEQEASVEVKNSKSSIKAKMKDGQPIITIEIKEKGFVGELTKPVLVTAKLLEDIEKEYENTVKQEIEKTINKIQKEYNANLLGFAGAIERKDPKYWNKHKDEWPKIYEELEVKVKVDAEIRDHGLIEHHLNENGKAE